MSWASHYVGIPYADISEPPENGADCFQLVRVVLKEQFRIEIPSLRYPKSEHSPADFERFLAQYEAFHKDWHKVEQPQEGDLILILRDKMPSHVGIVIDSQRFLHTTPATGAVVERLNDSWVRRLYGYFRHSDKYRESSSVSQPTN